MLQLFTKRQFNLGVILIFLSLIILQYFSAFQPLGTAIWSHSAPLAHGIYEVLGEQFISEPIVSFSLATVLILFQLILVYLILSKIKNFEKYSLIMTWVYCWMIHLFPEWSSFSPALLATTLLLFILYRIYTLADIQKNQFLFNISTLIGLSFLLWFPSIFLLPYLAILLFQYNVVSLKRISILFISFSIPILWYCLYFVFTGEPEVLFYKFSTFHFTKVDAKAIHAIQWIPLAIIAIFTVLGLLQAWSISNKTVKRSRLFISSLFVLVVCLGLGFSVSINEMRYSFQMLIFPMSLFIVFFINNFKRSKYSEIAHIILLLTILFNFVYQIFIF